MKNEIAVNAIAKHVMASSANEHKTIDEIIDTVIAIDTYSDYETGTPITLKAQVLERIDKNEIGITKALRNASSLLTRRK